MSKEFRADRYNVIHVDLKKNSVDILIGNWREGGIIFAGTIEDFLSKFDKLKKESAFHSPRMRAKMDQARAYIRGNSNVRAKPVNNEEPMSVYDAMEFCDMDIDLLSHGILLRSKEGTCATICQKNGETFVEIAFCDDVDDIKMVFKLGDASGFATIKRGASK